MTQDLDQLVSDVIAATAAVPPDVLADDSPALSLAGAGSIYLVGLIGGKDVGKSSLVNALVGLPISAATSSGPGTEIVIAYAHQSAVEQLEPLLASAVPGKYRIVTHDNVALARQVLLDLPDIDSVYADHIETTRRMLRHMLFPIWLQSIEKYADQQPQRLLARVAEGNDPRNFLFGINKIDLLVAKEGHEAANELCDDFARRIARTLSLGAPPRVFALSARHPERFDLPKLRMLVGQERDASQVSQSQQLATAQRSRTLLRWLDRQQLRTQADRAGRLLDEAEELVATRLATPILESSLPRLLDDSNYRAGLVEPAMRRRLSRWPVVGAINTVLSPVLMFVQKNVTSANGSAPPIDVVLDDSGPPLSDRIATTFARLHQLQPLAGERLASQKLWEAPTALAAAADLRQRLRGVADRQRQEMLDRVGGRTGVLAPVVRVLLTVGAILWFPIVQPILYAVLSAVSISNWTDLGRLIVDVLGATHMLKAGTFLLIWFGVLWLLLRWFTQRSADRLLARWRDADTLDPQLSFAAAVMEWIDDLLGPLRRNHERLEDLATRAAAASGVLREAA